MTLHIGVQFAPDLLMKSKVVERPVSIESKMYLTDADKAYHQIKEKIITVEMPPGSVIQETRLMQELGLGRTPIREALKQLKSENLVVVAPRRGMFVTDVAITDLPHIFEVRVELEALCARLAAQRITAQQQSQLTDLMAKCRQSDPGDKELFLSLDRRFHQLMAEAAGNKFLSSEVERFYNLSLRIWYLAINSIQPQDVDVDAHYEIVHAIKSRDSDTSERRMRKHIQHFHDTIKLYF
jgi:DNA-binding GntR family transcriptional regulator